MTRFRARSPRRLCWGAMAWLALAPVGAHAQTYSRTVATAYHDNTSVWVLGQVSSRSTDGVLADQTIYDASTARPREVWSFGALQQKFTWHGDGTMASISDARGNVTTLTGWKRGVPQSVGFADGAALTTVVNDSGWVTQSIDENGYATSYAHDAMGRIASIVYPGGDSTVWAATTQEFVEATAGEYGIPAGHWRQTVTTGGAVRTSYYDALWRPLLVHEYDASSKASTERYVGYEYDERGNVVFASYPSTSSNPDKGVWTTYDALGRVRTVSQDSEQGLLTTSTEYLSDATGAFTRVTRPGGQQVSTWHQEFGTPTADAPVRIVQPDGATTRISRDVFGKPVSIAR